MATGGMVDGAHGGVPGGMPGGVPGDPALSEALVAPRWRGTDAEWDDLVNATLLACALHHPMLGVRGAPCSCAGVLVDSAFLHRLLYVRRTNGRYLQEIQDARAAATR